MAAALTSLTTAMPGSGLSSTATAAKSGKKPNFVFIMSDGHALEAVSCYGSILKNYAKTPNIDRLARQGMRFTNFCCNNSICSPSRASFLTGQYSHKNGATSLGGKINPDSPWISEELGKAGYQSAVYGKWHLGSKPKGFDDYWVVGGQGEWFDPEFDGPRGKQTVEGYCSDVYTDIALDWLKKRDADKPFCLMLHFKAPHHSYEYPPRHDKLLEGVKVPEPENLYENVANTSPLMKNKLFGQMDAARAYYERHKNDTHPPMEPHDPTDHRSRVAAAYQHMTKKYIRCVTAVDENVGRVLDYLSKEGLVDNTVVVYTSDQGYWLGQHGLYDKRLILEESLKMPFIVRYPKEIKPSTVCDKLSMNIDMAETLLDYAGAKIPAAMQGASLRPLLKGKTPADWRKAIYYCYWAGPPHWGVRTERYTLAHFPGTEEIEFYDLKSDPHQNRNAAADPEYKKAIAETERTLRRLMKELGVSPDILPGASSKKKKTGKSGK